VKRTVTTRTLACLGATFLLGCLNTVTFAAPADGALDAGSPPAELGAPDVGTSVDAGGPATAVDVAPPRDATATGDGGEAPTVSCAATRCATGEQCCLTTGRCFDPRLSTGACTAPPQDSRQERTCASNADCAAGEFCGSDRGFCLGAGHCAQRGNCGSCSSSTPGACTVCGCDGVNYPDIQSSCLAGVRAVAAAQRACGTAPTDPDAGLARIPCATAAQCPAGQSCCAITGVCFETACSACCREPPAGTRFPCVTNAQCQRGEFCRGDGCDTPGGCVLIRGPSDCSGVVEQVCGCDGRTYVNACWAASGGTRVAHPGACP